MSQNEADLARSTASIPSAFHTEIPTLTHRGCGTLVTLLPNEMQQWYPLFAWRRQEKTKTSARATRPTRQDHLVAAQSRSTAALVPLIPPGVCEPSLSIF